MPEEKLEDQPLFVKVDGYKVILKELEAGKQIISNMKEAIEVLEKTREVKKKSINSFVDNISRLKDKIEEINKEMPELKEVNTTAEDIEEKVAVDKSVQELHSELKNLKSELGQL